MKLERRCEREITAALQEQLNNVLRGDKTPDAVVEKLDKYGQPLWNALRRMLLDGAMLGAESLIERLAAPVKAVPEEIQFSGVDWEMVNEEVRDWVLGPDMGDIPIGAKPAGYLGELYNQINQTSGKSLRRHIADWIESGEHLDVLKKDLEPMFGKTRAALISSTEVTRAYTLGNQKVWKASGLIDTPLPGEYSPPLHPRCILPGNEVVVLGPISAAAQSFYDGRCVEMSLGDGRKLSVTENHPILTPGGWVVAKDIRQGDNVIGTSDAQGIAERIEPDQNHVPTAIEKIFSSLEESGFVAAGGVPVAAEDFHGDGRFMHGNVDIIRPDGFLLADIKSRVAKLKGKFGLDGHNVRTSSFATKSTAALFIMRWLASLYGFVSGFDLAGTLFGSHARPLDGFRLGLCAGSNAGVYDTCTNDVATNTGFLRQLILGFAVTVAPKQAIEIVNRDLLDALHPFGFSLESDASVNKLPSQGEPIDSYFAGKFLHTFASMITFNEVVNIRNFDFTGHVYDLQCDMYGLYIIQGVLVKNCRCTTDVEELEPGVWHHIFLTAVDDRVCPICGPLHNTSVGIAKILPQEFEKMEER